MRAEGAIGRQGTSRSGGEEQYRTRSIRAKSENALFHMLI